MSISKTCWRVLLTALSSASFLSAQPGQVTPTIGPASPTTIGPYSPPHKSGVPDWVYNSRVPVTLRTQLEVLYGMLKARLDYQQDNNPSTSAEAYQKLGDSLTDIASSLAKDVPNTIPEWTWHIDDPVQIKWLQNRIREHVKQYQLEDIALSEDLVPSLRPATPATIGPGSKESKQLTSDEVKKLLGPGANEAAKPVAPPARPVQYCSETIHSALVQRDSCSAPCGGLPGSLRDIQNCFAKCNAAAQRSITAAGCTVDPRLF